MRGFYLWMRQQPAACITLGGLVCISVLVAMTGARVIELDSRIVQLITTERNLTITMLTLSEVVTLSDGRKVTVTATQCSDESLDVFVARYHAAVAAVSA